MNMNDYVNAVVSGNDSTLRDDTVNTMMLFGCYKDSRNESEKAMYVSAIETVLDRIYRKVENNERVRKISSSNRGE